MLVVKFTKNTFSHQCLGVNHHLPVWCCLSFSPFLGQKVAKMHKTGGNGGGEGVNQLNQPVGLSFDGHNNLYVVDHGNHRVQRFSFQ